MTRCSVMTCGSEIGNADRYNRRLCQAKGLACMGTAQIVMPENYIAMFNAPQVEEARQIVARAEPDIDNVIAAVRENRAFPPPRRKFYDRFMSGPVNPIFYSCFVKANAFTVGNACTGCGQCVRRCPLNNIALQTGSWVGYVVALDGCRVYVAGDTDETPEARAVTCDVAFLPVGGTYTMTAPEAASLANVLRPQVAVPTHYGSIVGRMSDGDDFAASLAPDIRCIKLI